MVGVNGEKVNLVEVQYLLDTTRSLIKLGAEGESSAAGSIYPRRNIASLPSLYLHIFIEYREMRGSVIGGQDMNGGELL
jgi:hypothetical protein